MDMEDLSSLLSFRIAHASPIKWMIDIIDWTAVGAIMTALMAIVTLLTVRQNRKQLKELRRQWDYENRPHISLAIVPRSFKYFLKIRNVGKNSAKEVSININDAFKATFDNVSIKHIDHLTKSFPMEANDTKYVFLGWIEKLNDKWKEDVEVEVSCCYDNFKSELTGSSENFIDNRFFMFYNYQEESLDNITKN